MAIIGIDLGTTNSLVAQLDTTGTPQIIHNKEGMNITPSFIWFEDSTKKNVKIGIEAKNNFQQEENIYNSFKTFMGSKTRYPFFNSNISPTDLSALILQKLKQDFEDIVGEAECVVITVPANFRNEAREATLAAAKVAGLKTDLLLNEPTAAALYYAYKEGKDLDGTYVIFDLGGGTLDVSVIKGKGMDIELLATQGVNRLGGDDFDAKIIELISNKFEEKFNKKFKPDLYNFTKNDAEEIKKALTTLDEKKVTLVGSDIPKTSFIITREEYEESISSFVVQAEMLCDSVLAEAKLKKEDITEVILAGGSSRTPIFQRSLKRVFGKKPIVFGNPDETIALGAAIYAGYKANKEILKPAQKKTVSAMKFQEIAPAYFGYISLDNDNKDFNSIIIKKNAKIPCSQTVPFYTIHDNQIIVNLTITQSPNAETDPKFVRAIWNGKLDLPPNRPKGMEVKVTYSYQENGVMRAEFIDTESNKKIEVDITAQSEGAKTTIDINDFIVE
jgi:molecular chaperone DnaK